jgi:hypothetical protein
MRKIIIDLILVSFVLGLIGWDSFGIVKADLEEVKAEIERIANGKELPPKEFYSDGCSFWPDDFLKHSWKDYCIKHDIYYWLGGTEEDKLKADIELRDNVNAVLPGMGDVLYAGVRAGGRNFIPLIPFPWGWGYGWDTKKESEN